MHKKDSTFKMNLKFYYYFHFFEIQFKIQDLRLYYSTAHLLNTTREIENFGKFIYIGIQNIVYKF